MGSYALVNQFNSNRFRVETNFHRSEPIISKKLKDTKDDECKEFQYLLVIWKGKILENYKLAVELKLEEVSYGKYDP